LGKTSLGVCEGRFEVGVGGVEEETFAVGLDGFGEVGEGVVGVSV
jgi:hypothetical protein